MPAVEFWSLSTIHLAVEALATVAFALSGLIDGARKKLDAVGVLSLIHI